MGLGFFGGVCLEELSAAVFSPSQFNICCQKVEAVLFKVTLSLRNKGNACIWPHRSVFLFP